MYVAAILNFHYLRYFCDTKVDILSSNIIIYIRFFLHFSDKYELYLNIQIENMPFLKKLAAILNFVKKWYSEKRYSLANSKIGFSVKNRSRKVCLPTFSQKCLG